MLRDHYKDLSIKDRRKITEYTSTPLRSLKSPSPEVSPIKIQTEGAKKKNLPQFLPYKQDQKQKENLKTMWMLLKKILFLGKYLKL